MSNVLTFAAPLAALATLFLFRRLKGGPALAPADLKTTLEAGATVIDVRTPGEFRTGAYRGALNIPLQELEGRLGEIPKTKPVVLYCASGARSAAATSLLKRAGFAEVFNGGGLYNMPR